jgi:hypothetical protein
MAGTQRKQEGPERRPEASDAREKARRDATMLLSGMVVGFGLAAVASVLFNLFQEQSSRRRRSQTTESRIRRQDESGGVLGDLSHIIDESTSAFKDAVKTLDRTFESGKAALDSIQDVINRIRE